MIIGHTRDVARFATRDRYAAYCGTAPISFDSGGRSIHRLSLRGNRQLNHAMHIIAVTQIRHRHSPGRAFYDRKLEQGKTPKEALRALKRRITDVVFAQLRADAEQRGPGGQAGRLMNPARPTSHPKSQHFGRTTPGPPPTLRPHVDARHEQPAEAPERALDNKEEIATRSHGRSGSGNLRSQAVPKLPIEGGWFHRTLDGRATNAPGVVRPLVCSC